MRRLLLLFPSFILQFSPLSFFLTPKLGSLVPLRHNQLCVDNLFVFLLLTLNNRLLRFFEDFHSGLFEGLLAEDIKHGLNLLIKIEELNITFVDLRMLAIFFVWHLWLEKWYGRPVEIEFGGDALLRLLRLVCEKLLVLFGLAVHVLAAGYGVGGWDVAIWINVARPFSRNASELLKGSFFRILLVHNHGVRVGAGGNDHSRIRATPHDSPVMHDVLREILSVKTKGKLDWVFGIVKFVAKIQIKSFASRLA